MPDCLHDRRLSSGQRLPPSRSRDRHDELIRARCGFDWNKQFNLFMDPESARNYHDEKLPADFYMLAWLSSMCGPKLTKLIEEDLIKT